MEQDGHLKNLAERLKEKAEQERIETEKVFTEQLQTLSSNLLASSQNALRTTMDAMAGELTTATTNLRQHYQTLSMAYGRAWLRTAITALAVFLGMLIGGWGLVAWATYRLRSHRTELSRLKAECNQQHETLEALKAGTWGLSLRESEKGRFIVLPDGTKAVTGWTWGDKSTIKLE